MIIYQSDSDPGQQNIISFMDTRKTTTTTKKKKKRSGSQTTTIYATQEICIISGYSFVNFLQVFYIVLVVMCHPLPILTLCFDCHQVRSGQSV